MSSSLPSRCSRIGIRLVFLDVFDGRKFCKEPVVGPSCPLKSRICLEQETPSPLPPLSAAEPLRAPQARSARQYCIFSIWKCVSNPVCMACTSFECARGSSTADKPDGAPHLPLPLLLFPVHRRNNIETKIKVCRRRHCALSCVCVCVETVGLRPTPPPSPFVLKKTWTCLLTNRVSWEVPRRTP